MAHREDHILAVTMGQGESQVDALADGKFGRC
jgi:hypothetical protein